MENKNNTSSWELVNFCEFDKFAVKSYCAVHGVDESLNLGDITKADENNLEPFKIICGGTPCQDFPLQANKQEANGFAKTVGMNLTH